MPALPFLILLILLQIAYTGSAAAELALDGLPLPGLAVDLLKSATGLAFMFAPLVAIEQIWPASKGPRQYWVGLKFWLVHLVFVALMWRGMVHLFAIRDIQPLMTWTPGEQMILMPLAIMASRLVTDFCYYWMHRAQHAIPVLWRFHAVHHSFTNLNTINSAHHLTEEILRVPLTILPVALLIQIELSDVVILTAFASVWGHYIHADTRVNMRWALPWIADNSFHRIHHSVEQRHFNKNFASFFPLLDLAFGTYLKPDQSWPATGLPNQPQPETVFEYVVAPFIPAQSPQVTSLTEDA
jgi:sterol desaturase/sphingolipid hydroxylase (fatty acid hydroxylase superfamily)